MGRKLSRSNVAKKAWATRRKNANFGKNPATSKEEVATSYQSTMMALEDAINQLIVRVNEQTTRIRNLM